MKRFVTMILSVIMLLSIGVTPVFAASETETHAQQDALEAYFLELHSNEFYITQMESIKTYNQLLQSMEMYAMTNSSSADSQYWDYYGGAYIDDQTGKLVVLVTDLSSFTLNKMRTFSRNGDSIQFQLCDTPYNQILNAIEILSENIEYLESQGVYIDSIRDDVLNNCVVVDMQELNPSKIAIVKTVADYDFLHFKNSEGITLDVSVEAGTGIYNVNTNMLSTLGFAATLDGEPGFVVSGHSAKTIGDEFATDAEELTIGTVIATAWRNKSTADAAFVQAARRITPTNELASGSGNIWGTTSYRLPANTTISMLGQESGLTSGKLQSYSVTSNHASGITIYDQWCATYSSDGGDSGAPIMLYEGKYDVSRYTLLGIHSGRNTKSNVSYFTPYQNIVDELGIEFIDD